MTLENIIQEARKLLPPASVFREDKVRIRVNNLQLNINIENQLDEPTEFDRPYYIVEFRKKYNQNILIGWEFVELCNGF